MSDQSLVVVEQQKSIERWTGITREQIERVKEMWFKSATDSELEMAIQICNRLQLDPFSRQIYFIKRWDSAQKKEIMTAQPSIDGFRLTAQRTGQYRGQTEPQWCGSDGKWLTVWLSDSPPVAARCGVYRDGFTEPMYAVAKFNSYAGKTKDGKLTHMWRKMPEVMIHKCAEALALRKAFPNELSGVYTYEEMQQAENSKRTESNGQEEKDKKWVISKIKEKIKDQKIDKVDLQIMLESVGFEKLNQATYENLVDLEILIDEYIPDEQLDEDGREKRLADISSYCHGKNIGLDVISNLVGLAHQSLDEPRVTLGVLQKSRKALQDALKQKND